MIFSNGIHRSTEMYTAHIYTFMHMHTTDAAILCCTHTYAWLYFVPLDIVICYIY